MAFARSSVQMFSLANPKYALQMVTFYTVDVDGNPTTILAPLYADVLGAAQLSNPQVLDSKGKFVVPVYIDAPVIGVIANGLLSPQQTGIISAFGGNRGPYVMATLYYENDTVQDPVTGIIYTVPATYLSTTVAADVASGNLDVFLSAAELLTGIISSSTTTVTVNTGTQNFTIDPGKSFTVGCWVTVASRGTPTSYMSGPVTAYNSTTGALTVNVQSIGVVGSHSDWNVELSGVPGPTPTITATSTTSNAIGTGALTFTTQANLSIIAGMFLIISQVGTPGNYVHGQITSYSGTTLVMNITDTGGSGTIANWNIGLSGSQGTVIGALLVANNLSDLANTTTALTNLGPGLNGQTYGGSTISGANDALWFYSASASATRKMAIQDVLGTTHGLTSKSTLSLLDEILIQDSAASFASKKSTLSAVATAVGAGGGVSVTVNSANLVLTASSNKYQLVKMTAAGLTVQLPDATTMTAGIGVFKIRATADSLPFTVTDVAGQPRAILNPNDSAGVDLSSISTASGNYSCSNTNQGTFNPSIIGYNVAKAQVIDASTTTGTAEFIPLTSSTVLCLYTDSATINISKAVVLTISGETITVGTPVNIATFASGAASIQSGCALSATSVLVHYGTQSGTVVNSAVILSISGTTITVNTPAVVDTVALFPLGIWTISSTSAFLMYSSSSAAAVKGVVLSVSATTITVNTKVSGAAATGSATRDVTQISTTQYMTAYDGTTSYLAVQLWTISGTTVTAVTAVTNLSSSVAITGKLIPIAISATVIFVLYSTSANNLLTTQLSLSGTTLSAGTTFTGLFNSIPGLSSSTFYSYVLLSPNLILLYGSIGGSGYFCIIKFDAVNNIFSSISYYLGGLTQGSISYPYALGLPIVGPGKMMITVNNASGNQVEAQIVNAIY